MVNPNIVAIINSIKILFPALKNFSSIKRLTNGRSKPCHTYIFSELRPKKERKFSNAVIFVSLFAKITTQIIIADIGINNLSIKFLTRCVSAL